jgi:hypothetical protein
MVAGNTYTISFDVEVLEIVGEVNSFYLAIYDDKVYYKIIPIEEGSAFRYSTSFVANTTGTFPAQFIIYINSHHLIIKDVQINEGYNTLYRENPYDVGYGVGYNEGYKIGKDEGLTNTVTFSWFSSFLSGFSSLLNIQIFPNITLGTLAGVSLLLGFIAFLFKLKGGD